jgi:hypothetical protein
MTAFVLSGDLRATTFSAVYASLAALGTAITVHHDVDFDWCDPGAVDITFESSTSLGGHGLDYVVRGTIDGQLDMAIARVRRIAEALDSRDIAYRFELDHDDGETVAIQSRTFPCY